MLIPKTHFCFCVALAFHYIGISDEPQAVHSENYHIKEKRKDEIPNRNTKLRSNNRRRIRLCRQDGHDL